MLHPLELLTSCFILFYLGLSFAIIFVLIPWVSLGRQPDMEPLERVWHALLIGTTYFSFLGLALAPMQFHDLPGLISASGVLFIAYLALIRHVNVRSAWDELYHKNLGGFYDFLDENHFFSARYGGVVRFLNIYYWRDASRHWGPARLLTWGVFLYGAYLRVYDPLSHLTFGFSDPYVHIVWLKQFNHGDIYADGVYPRGYHAFLSVLGTLSGLEPAMIIRFIGCLMGSLTAPALYFLFLECRLPWSGALFGVAAFSITGLFGLGDLLQRQTAALPEEFAMVFVFVTLGFAVRYLRLGYDRDLWAFFCGVCLIWAIHSMAGMALFAAGGAIIIDFLFRRRKSWLRLRLVLRNAIVGAVVGNIYIILGLLTGHHIHGATLSYLLNSYNSGGSMGPLEIMMLQVGPVIVGMLAAGVLLMLYGLGRPRTPFPSQALLVLWGWIVLGTWALKVLANAPIPLGPDRLIMIMVYPCCGILAWSYTLIVEPLLGKGIARQKLRACVLALAIGTLAWGFYIDPPAPPHPESDEAARAYYEVGLLLPRGTWTLVGQAEEYELTLDRGYHMQLGQFLQLYHPQDPTLKFPTPVTIIVVEKHRDNIPDAYRKPERLLQEAELKDWLHLYAFDHRDLRLFEEDKEAAIYTITRPVTAESERTGKF